MAEPDDSRELESQVADAADTGAQLIAPKGPRPVRRVVDEPAQGARPKKAKGKKPSSAPQKKGQRPAKPKGNPAARDGSAGTNGPRGPKCPPQGGHAPQGQGQGRRPDGGQGPKRPADPRARQQGGRKAPAGKGGPKGSKRRRKGAPGAPRKRHTKRNIVIVIVVAIALFFGIDVIANSGKIHSGVTVGGLDVGGMTVDEAAALISLNFEPQIQQGTVTMYVDEEAASSTEEATPITFDYDVLEQFNAEPPKGKVFSVEPSTLGARIDGRKLAEDAYSIGRGADFVFGRIRACTVGTPIDLEVEVNQKSVEALEGLLTSFLGKAMVNPNIVFQDGSFVVTEGNDGYMVTADRFEELLKNAMLDTERSFVIPMADVRMEVGEDAARNAAAQADKAIEEPVTLVYGDSTWELGRDFLGQAINTYVTDAMFGNALTPYVSLEKVTAQIPALEGIGDVGTPAQNVHFSYDGTTLSSTPASNGIGPDYVQITDRLNEILFGNANLSEEAGETPEFESGETQEAPADNAQEGDGNSQEGNDRRVVMNLVESYPTMTLEDAEELGLTTGMIASYTTDFDGATENKAHNIKLLSDILSNTVVEPGGVFSVNEIAGDCNEEKGFMEAGSILDGTVTSEIGGGICAVATTVFNATFNAGYNIVERHNHSNYMTAYPDGQDAAISYPYMDFSFQNDSNHPVLVLVDYTDTTVTCSLWGISPGYRAESEMTDWIAGDEYVTVRVTDPDYPEGQEYVKSYGENGHTTVIERKVYNEAGELIKDDDFTSYYLPKKQVVAVGTNTGSSSSGDGGGYDDYSYEGEGYDDSEGYY